MFEYGYSLFTLSFPTPFQHLRLVYMSQRAKSTKSQSNTRQSSHSIDEESPPPGEIEEKAGVEGSLENERALNRMFVVSDMENHNERVLNPSMKNLIPFCDRCVVKYDTRLFVHNTFNFLGMKILLS